MTALSRAAPAGPHFPRTAQAGETRQNNMPTKDGGESVSVGLIGNFEQKKTMTNVIVAGASGRMGQRICY
ncbi:MAG: hypothetical protein D3904_16055, partial [Candidatus Electrothrix sp. EH2]|nr:hypothetical protein [Candidatus Electrothrix sp. EH2]